MIKNMSIITHINNQSHVFYDTIIIMLLSFIVHQAGVMHPNNGPPLWSPPLRRVAFNSPVIDKPDGFLDPIKEAMA